MENRELDAQVAEKVMGWRKDGAMWVTAEGRTPDGWDYASREVLPNFTESISWAWQVVEKMWPRMPKTSWGIYRFQLNRRDSGEWVCEFAPDAEGDWRSHAVGKADTAPKAICLAALAAVEGK